MKKLNCIIAIQDIDYSISTNICLERYSSKQTTKRCTIKPVSHVANLLFVPQFVSSVQLSKHIFASCSVWVSSWTSFSWKKCNKRYACHCQPFVSSLWKLYGTGGWKGFLRNKLRNRDMWSLPKITFIWECINSSQTRDLWIRVQNRKIRNWKVQKGKGCWKIRVNAGLSKGLGRRGSDDEQNERKSPNTTFEEFIIFFLKFIEFIEFV